jgi:acetylornithine deacetylase/succinyl-diaminopimelate desuccinylase-like protein
VARIARAIVAITAEKMPVTMTETTREFFKRLGDIFPDPESIPKLDAVLRHTVSPTVLNAGVRHNVIPTEAEALLSLRTLPGHSPEVVIDQLRSKIGDHQVELTIDTAGCAAPASPIHSPGFAALRDTLAELDPTIVSVPYLSTGATESAFLRRHGVKCYGILPFPLADEDEARMHDHDERVSVEAFGFGVRLMYGAVRRLVAS